MECFGGKRNLPKRRRSRHSDTSSGILGTTPGQQLDTSCCILAAEICNTWGSLLNTILKKHTAYILNTDSRTAAAPSLSRGTSSRFKPAIRMPAEISFSVLHDLFSHPATRQKIEPSCYLHPRTLRNPPKAAPNHPMAFLGGYPITFSCWRATQKHQQTKNATFSNRLPSVALCPTYWLRNLGGPFPYARQLDRPQVGATVCSTRQQAVAQKALQSCSRVQCR